MKIKALCLITLVTAVAGCASHSPNLQVGNELTYTSLKEHRDALRRSKFTTPYQKELKSLGKSPRPAVTESPYTNPHERSP